MSILKTKVKQLLSNLLTPKRETLTHILEADFDERKHILLYFTLRGNITSIINPE